MPELPEVETVARQLAPLLTGRSVKRFRVLDPRLRNGPTPRVAGRTIRTVSRSGKRVLLEFSPRGVVGGGLWLAVHLRMTGRLLWTARPARADRSHLRAQFLLDRGALLFTDVRRFGTLDWFNSAEEAAPTGRDPLDPGLTASGLAGLLGESGQQIKSWLLRQDRLVGLGNIYASEILYSAGISPFRAAGSLQRAEQRRLHAAMRRILRRAIENCGTTFSDFRDARGVTGSYRRYLKVYLRDGKPCRRCHAAIERVVQGQRSTFYCRNCQS